MVSRINEVFTSIQGEGKTQGQIRTFIRFNGCNLRCKFCDTPYTWGKGDQEKQDWTDLIKSPNIVLTGGEPCLSWNWQFFIDNILPLKFIKHIEVETNGTMVPASRLRFINLWNISPKNPSKLWDGKGCSLDLLSKKHLLNDYIVKFVIEDENDKGFVEDIKKSFNIPNEKIWIMPLTDKNDLKKSAEIASQIFDFCIEKNYNYSARIHVLVKNNIRGL